MKNLKRIPACAFVLFASAVLCGAMEVQTVINQLGLVPMVDEACPGYYRETYQSTAFRAAMDKERHAASLIYYLMTTEHRVDPWHRLTSDEIMLYHGGAPMHIVLLYPGGTWATFTLGPRFDEGHQAQVVIPAGTWMGFVLLDTPEFNWGLYGVMVVPGWHLDDLEFVFENDIAPLREQFPEAFQHIDEKGWTILQGSSRP